MRKLALILCLTVTVTAGPAVALFSVLGFKNSMIEFLLDQLSTEGVFEITVEKVEEPEDGSTAIQGLAIRDKDGVWFTAETLNFSWNSSRLLRGEVEFQNLSMAGVTVLRQPILPPGEEAEALDAATPEVTEGAFEWPRSPLTLRIDRLALERVRLEPAVLGQAISFDAEGAARDEGDIQSARLDLRRTDAVEGTIAFDYARTFSDNTLALNLAAREGVGGLVAFLAGLPEDSPSVITLKASGPPTDWQLALDLDLADTLSADGTAAISYEGPIKVDADFSARPGSKLSPDIANLLGTEAQLIAQASEGPDGVIVIEDGRLNAPDLNLVASGTYARETGRADLTVDLAARAGLAKPFDAFDFQELTFKGTVQGAPGNIAADGDLGLNGLRTQPVDVATATLVLALRQSTPQVPSPDPAATAPIPPPLTATSVDLSGGTTGLRLDRIGADIIGPADLQVVAELTGDDLLLETAWLDSNLLKISVSGEADLETQDLEIGFGLSTPRMGQVASAYGVDADGQIAVTGQASRTDGVLTLDTVADLTGLTHPMAAARSLHTESTVVHDGTTTRYSVTTEAQHLRLDQVGPDLLPEVEILTSGLLSGDELHLSVFRLESAPVNIGAEGVYNLADNSAQMRYELEAPRLQDVALRYDADVSGSLVAKGRAILPARESGDPQLDGNANLSGLTFQGTSYGDVALDHAVTVSATPNGTLSVALTSSAFGPSRLKTGFVLDQPTLRLTEIDGDFLGLRASGALTADLQGSTATGDLTLGARSLAPMSRLAGTPLAGVLKGTLSLTAPGGQQNAGLRLTATGLKAADATVRLARIEATLRNLLGTPTIKADIGASDVAAGNLALTTLDATVAGPLSRLDLTARLAGKARDKPLTGLFAASANLAAPTMRATVNRLEATLHKDRIALRSPLDISARGSSISAKGLDVALPDDGSLSGDVAKIGNAYRGALGLIAPRLDFLRRLADVPILSGGIEAAATFDTRRQANVTLTGRGLVFDGVEGTGALDIDTDLAWQGRRAEVSTTVAGDFGKPLKATASLPIRVAGGLPQLARRGDVSAQIDWTGEIGQLWALVPAPGHIVTGSTTIDLGVSGDISAPDLSGGLRIADGGYQNLDLGTILTDLAVETTLLPGGDLGLSLKASDGGKGTLDVTGSVALDASGIDLRTTIVQAVLVRRDEAKARIDGNIAIKGPANALVVDGALTVQEAEVRLINNNPPSVVTLGDVLIKGEPEPEPDDGDSSVTLNIDIDAPGRLFVRGRGLDSEWAMGLKVRGDAASPRVTGRIERVRGRLDLLGKGFDLKRGRVDFDGGRQIDPRIDVVLEREANNLTGRIVVDGYASDPQLGFSSTPNLPSDEVLPRVLFGKSSQALSGSQAIQLGLGLATLMDGGGGTLDRVRGAVGLDSLRVEEDDEGNAAIAVGKEVAEGVWVGTKQSLGEGGTSVVVEVDIFEGITLDGEATETGNSSVGLKWKKDF